MRIAICDDNSEILVYLKESLYNLFIKYTTDFKITCFRTGNSFLEAYQKDGFDIVFLDIDMPIITGFNIAKTMRDALSKCFIVFITSHSELVYDSLEFQPFDFVRKNLNESLNKSLSKTVKRLMFQIKQTEKIVLENSFSRKIPVPISKIMYLESDKHNINFYVSGEETAFRLRKTIKECEQKLEKYDFIRIHKSYLLNFRYVDIIDKSRDEIVLKETKERLPMSRNLKKEIIEKYILYLRELI